MRNSQARIVVAGSSLASMVMVEKLSRTQDVEWRLDETKLLKSHFFGHIGYSGLAYDLGMNALEVFSSPGKMGEEETLPLRRYGIQSGIRESRMWLQEYAQLNEVGMSFSSEAEGKVPDFMLSDDFRHVSKLATLNNLGTSDSIEGMPHPSEKIKEPAIFEGAPLAHYFEKSYGKHVSTLLLNWSRQYFGRILEELPTPLHRLAWLPLPHPETILAVVNGTIDGTQHLKSFHFANSAPLALLFRGIYSDIEARGRVHKLGYDDKSGNGQPDLPVPHATFEDSGGVLGGFHKLLMNTSESKVCIQFWLCKDPLQDEIRSFSGNESTLLRLTSWGSKQKTHNGFRYQMTTESKRILDPRELCNLVGTEASPDGQISYFPSLPGSDWYRYLEAAKQKGTVDPEPGLIRFDSLSGSLNEHIYFGLLEAGRHG